MSTVVKFTRNGVSAEILCNQDTVTKYREGILGLSKVLQSDDIYKNSKKGDHLSESDRTLMFGSKSQQECLLEILTSGDYQLSTREMRELKDRKRRELITYIMSSFVDARGFPYPDDVIDRHLTKKKVNIDYRKSASSLFDENRRKIEGTDFILKRKPGIKQAVCVSYSNYGAAQGALSRFIVNEEHHSAYAEITIDVPPAETDRVLALISKYEYHPGTSGPSTSAGAGKSKSGRQKKKRKKR